MKGVKSNTDNQSCAASDFGPWTYGGCVLVHPGARRVFGFTLRASALVALDSSFSLMDLACWRMLPDVAGGIIAAAYTTLAAFRIVPMGADIFLIVISDPRVSHVALQVLWEYRNERSWGVGKCWKLKNKQPVGRQVQRQRSFPV